MRKPFINEAVSKIVEPILTGAEIDIKLVIKQGVFKNKPLQWIQQKINKIVDEAIKALPKELPNRESFRSGLIASAIKWHKYMLESMSVLMSSAVGVLNAAGMSIPKKSIEIVIKALSNIPPATAQKYRYLGFTSVPDYVREINERIKYLARSPLEDVSVGDRKMTLFAKTEMELRHEHQMSMVEERINNGETIQRFSKHSSCSERCEKWQGKLADLEKPPIDKSMWTGDYYNREKVYSFGGITNQIDKYGYKNNIIVGFNCRHTLIPPDKKISIEYTKEEIEKDRKINAKMRSMERGIRNARKTYLLIDDKEGKALWNKRANTLRKKYYNYAKENDIAYYDWRIEIPKDTIERAR